MRDSVKNVRAKPFNGRLTSARPSRSGKVWLVGAGPGDAQLLTLKALRTIENADIIFYDQLVSDDIRALFPSQVPALYVGKAKNCHSVGQDDLNQWLVDQARMGLQVCRLKGGDPFVFGRGGEELLVLRRACVDAEVVPGITAASGCSASAGIPLTHRGLSQGCTFVTAHAEKDLNLQWQALVQLQHTLVFYMGVTRAEQIAEGLHRAGMAPNTPTAIVENGCRNKQRLFTTSLARLPQTVNERSVQSPALIVVGEVVQLAQALRPEQFVSLLDTQSLQQCLSA